MDIALQGGVFSPLNQELGRPIDAVNLNGGESNFGASIHRMSELVADRKAGVTDLPGAIDKLRADFDMFRLRLERQADTKVVSESPRDAVQALSDAMDRSVRTQVNILELGVALNAGLTATQQSQNSVKTLLEKS